MEKTPRRSCPFAVVYRRCTHWIGRSWQKPKADRNSFAKVDSNLAPRMPELMEQTSISYRNQFRMMRANGEKMGKEEIFFDTKPIFIPAAWLVCLSRLSCGAASSKPPSPHHCRPQPYQPPWSNSALSFEHRRAHNTRHCIPF